MLFHSQVFLLVFLPITLAVYYRAAGNRELRLSMLLFASFVFYGYWDLRFVPLLAGSIVANWLLARHHAQRPHRWLLAAGIGLNLGLLGVFKYANFLAGSVGALAGIEAGHWDIILPLGISFFTFQQISYLADLGRGQAPRYGLRDYALYIAFFPQLIAGPIVRHGEVIPQYHLDPRRAGCSERMSRGLVLLLIGLAKKGLLADNLARIATPVFATAAAGNAPDPGAAWAGIAAFSMQIYFDFSAYSDMAIGLALMFGLVLPLNFNAPYRAASISDFWRRWHMTLSRFLRDYLYIPLGGNRHGRIRELLALTGTMLLGGLWHGAAWTFVAWGAMHGIGLAAHHAWQRLGIRLPIPVGWCLTFLFVSFAWVLFRAESFTAARLMFDAMAGTGDGGTALPSDSARLLWLLALATFLSVFAPTSHRFALEMLRPRRTLAVAVAIALVAMTVYLGGPGSQEFIYFQF